MSIEANIFSVILRDDYGMNYLIEKTSSIDKAKEIARQYEKNMLQAVSLFINVDSLDAYHYNTPHKRFEIVIELDF